MSDAPDTAPHTAPRDAASDPPADPPPRLSLRQVWLPLYLSSFLGIAAAVTVGFFVDVAMANAVTGPTDGLGQRLLTNDLCLVILTVFLIATGYGALQFAGFRVDRRRIQAVPEEAEAMPVLAFVTGRPSDALAAQDARRLPGLDDLTVAEHQYVQNLAPIQFAIWVLPLLGFIGTVVGITRAIGGLRETVSQVGLGAADLTSVFAGLEFAFDTTFLGLVLVIPLMALTYTLRALAMATLDQTRRTHGVPIDPR